MMCTRTDPESIMKLDSPCASLKTTNHIGFLYKLNPTNSVFQAELAAIGFAAGWALEHNQLVNIHTDSQSSIEAIKSAKPKSEFVNSIKEKIYSSRLLVSLTWVKAHAGNPGNERADHQAKLPTTIGQYLDLPVPYSYVKLKIKQFIIHEWENYWNQHNSSSIVRVGTFMGKVDKTFLIVNKYLLCFLSGHGPFPAYLHRFHLLNSPSCSCGQVGDSDHYIFDCPLTKEFHLKKPAAKNKDMV
ncbi:hypothetical protein AVEN_179205-1 [Araneus ventricosus]|uniref:RNase H type-1 domain-containing protein n=1 Tax=Araneus ventricosus TaxID=182803 RepID=A0A4Y2C7Q9_ARAVE|nr:hypothetical protein AVEN_179205-1 [Araneus ventricosus]